MTSFVKYYVGNKCIEYSMTDISNLILDEQNKKEIADAIYHRLYGRFLKIFFFKSSETNTYVYSSEEIERNVFDTEFKNGFSIMANCCLLIEVLSAFLDGNDQTPKNHSKAFKKIFLKAKSYNNELGIFEKEVNFYYSIRCGILHQGETYKGFKIRRSGKLYDSETQTINSSKFATQLEKFLKEYTEELSSQKWDSELWDNCRQKLRFIIQNS